MTRGQEIVQPRAFIGVDPGAKGALAFVSEDHVAATTLPYHTGRFVNVQQLLDWVTVQLMMCEAESVRALGLENVRAFKQGRQSAFNFGSSFGQLAACSLLITPHVCLVEPLAWQVHGLGRGTGGDKSVSLDAAMIKWPHVLWARTKAAREGQADALWLAHYVMTKPCPTIHEIG